MLTTGGIVFLTKLTVSVAPSQQDNVAHNQRQSVAHNLREGTTSEWVLSPTASGGCCCSQLARECCSQLARGHIAHNQRLAQQALLLTASGGQCCSQLARRRCSQLAGKCLLNSLFSSHKGCHSFNLPSFKFLKKIEKNLRKQFVFIFGLEFISSLDQSRGMAFFDFRFF